MIKKYLLYMGRWQLSTPILALVLWLLHGLNPVIVTIIANLIGSLIFFWVDKFIFRTRSKEPLWEISPSVECYQCGKVGVCYRIVEWRGYNRREVKNPQYRCETCRGAKMHDISLKMEKNEN
jgi:hypothetical protein